MAPTTTVGSAVATLHAPALLRAYHSQLPFTVLAPGRRFFSGGHVIHVCGSYIFPNTRARATTMSVKIRSGTGETLLLYGETMLYGETLLYGETVLYGETKAWRRAQPQSHLQLPTLALCMHRTRPRMRSKNSAYDPRRSARETEIPRANKIFRARCCGDGHRRGAPLTGDRGGPTQPGEQAEV